jgi:hypothetical protein
MGAMSPSEAALATFLTQVGLAYQGTPGAVAGRVMPRVGTDQQAGAFPVFNRADWLRAVGATGKAPGEKPRSFPYTMSSTSYYCRGYQAGENVNVELLDGSDPLDILARSTEHVIDILNTDFEVRASRALWAGVGSSATITLAASTTAVASVAAIARQAIISTTGLAPNRVIIPAATYDLMNSHPDVTRQAVGSNGRERLGSIFDVAPENILVPTIVANFGQDGVTSYAAVWSTSILVCYAADQPGPNQASFAYQLHWNQGRVSQTVPSGAIQVATTRDQEAGTIRVWARAYAHELVTCPELGFLITV